MSGQVLIAVTHLLGIGHLVRARHLARALAQAGYGVTLASGGMPDGRAATDHRFVQLPPVRTEGTDFRNLLDEDGRAAMPERLAARRGQLAALAQELRPDIVITEHFPFGRRKLAEEFLVLIAAARTANPRTLVLSSIRDVLVAPQRPERIAEAAERIAMLFDAVLVHGDRGFLPLEVSWPVTPELAGKLVYTGYLRASAQSPHPEEGRRAVLKDAPGGSGASPTILRDASSGETAPEDQGGEIESDAILVSGGGSAAALPLFETALAAARLLPQRPFHLLIGQGVAEAEFAGLVRRAPGNAVVERARPDFPALLAGSALSLSLAGYNTVLDLVQARRPALVAPFDAGSETEQSFRAAALERAGLARLVRPEDGPEALVAAIAQALESGRPAALRVDLDGAAGTVAALARLRARAP